METPDYVFSLFSLLLFTLLSFFFILSFSFFFTFGTVRDVSFLNLKLKFFSSILKTVVASLIRTTLGAVLTIYSFELGSVVTVHSGKKSIVNPTSSIISSNLFLYQLLASFNHLIRLSHSHSSIFLSYSFSPIASLRFLFFLLHNLLPIYYFFANVSFLFSSFNNLTTVAL